MNDFDLFIQKATERQNRICQPFTLDVKEYGPITFIRPNTKQLLNYIDKASNAVVMDSSGNVIEQNTNLMQEAASELVYFSCPALQKKELQERLNIKNPIDAPFECFGVQETLTLANSIFEMVEGVNVSTEVNEELKNS